MSNSIIYLDYNATTPVEQKVLEQMLPYFNVQYGNASSSTHIMGWQANAAVEKARKQAADFLEVEPNEIIFTSGASESIYLALTGIYNAYKVNGNRIITTKTEHKAVLNVLGFLEKMGAEVIYLDVDRQGLINLEEYKKSFNDKTILVAIQLCNNETGVIQPLDEISEYAHQQNVVVFSDATQAPGKMIFNPAQYGIDCMPLSAHKIYGPKGCGLLYIKRKNPRVTLLPLMEGNNERNLRMGTSNVPAIVGFGAALELAAEQLWADVSTLSKLRTALEQQLTQNGFGVINGSTRNRICNTTNIMFPGIKAAELIKKTPELCYSLGSACNSNLNKPSYVLTAMGLSHSEASSSIRISIGRHTKPQEIEIASKVLKSAVQLLRNV